MKKQKVKVGQLLLLAGGEYGIVLSIDEDNYITVQPLKKSGYKRMVDVRFTRDGKMGLV